MHLKIEFTIEGIKDTVFCDDSLESFGLLAKPNEEVLNAINKCKPDDQKEDLVKGKAVVSYYTGNANFLENFNSVLGDISFNREIQIDLTGRGMKDKLYVRISFDQESASS